MSKKPDSITIRRPDDWHLHFRDGATMQAVVPYTARQFGRAIVMPNLTPRSLPPLWPQTIVTVFEPLCRRGWILPR